MSVLPRIIDKDTTTKKVHDNVVYDNVYDSESRSYFMPAKDMFHQAVKNALIKEGWSITHDPLFLRFGGVDLYVDLGAEKVIAAQKGERKIAVEVKSFVNPSVMFDFHLAIGQYIDYRTALAADDPERMLFLAVPSTIYKSFFTLPFTQTVVAENHLKLLVYDIRQEAISVWQT